MFHFLIKYKIHKLIHHNQKLIKHHKSHNHNLFKRKNNQNHHNLNQNNIIVKKLIYNK